ncbi:hypothetical protein [Pelagicoccus sp. SDUM812005]|uniref:hypothetical protein n=1 Tax=Pelagicoccus sp. SDUM812005 TaxID=3041257 RepID=UPI00280DB980|nr:hypothetical protein [Pelagicoccus sp. SDUM812005]MDQ8183776.1 hypothetical protein [Pelagicoccus sp. SDUM812005]
MTQTHRRRPLILGVLIVLLLFLLLLFVRCQRPSNETPTPPVDDSAESAPPASQAPAPEPDSQAAEEVLDPATLQAPAEVSAGKRFSVDWTGPDNAKDYITIVRMDAADTAYGNYEETRQGSPLPLLAPIEAGEWELRYVADRSRTVLARRPLLVTENAVTLQAPDEVIAGSVVSVSWTGPDNKGDYLTFVPRSLPDGRYGNYAETRKGSPLEITAPIEPGDIELRYVTGQGAKVLGRFPLRVVPAEITLSAPSTARAGETIRVNWSGPDNKGDYLTLVPATLPDGQYQSYADTKTGQELTLTAPKAAGPAEIRYMSGQGAQVLKRVPILVLP